MIDYIPSAVHYKKRTFLAVVVLLKDLVSVGVLYLQFLEPHGFITLQLTAYDFSARSQNAILDFMYF